MLYRCSSKSYLEVKRFQKKDYQKVQKIVEEEGVVYGNVVYGKHIINRVLFARNLLAPPTQF